MILFQFDRWTSSAIVCVLSCTTRTRPETNVVVAGEIPKANITSFNRLYTPRAHCSHSIWSTLHVSNAIAYKICLCRVYSGKDLYSIRTESQPYCCNFGQVNVASGAILIPSNIFDAIQYLFFFLDIVQCWRWCCCCCCCSCVTITCYRFMAYRRRASAMRSSANIWLLFRMHDTHCYADAIQCVHLPWKSVQPKLNQIPFRMLAMCRKWSFTPPLIDLTINCFVRFVFAPRTRRQTRLHENTARLYLTRSICLVLVEWVTAF